MAGIYLHIPFCKQACHYCNFHFSTSLKYKTEMVEAILMEIDLQKAYLNGATIQTIYFGGGTPSLLSAQEINQIFDKINSTFSIAPEAEITLEANPDDLTLEKLEAFQQTPINRLSIGIQSFSEADLKYMNRAHNAQEASACLENALSMGFENLTIDLIYGTPTTSHAQWEHNLEMIFKHKIPHISCYCLTVEPNTALAHFVKNGKAKPVDEEHAAIQFETLINAMEAEGYEHYEISNFAKPGLYSKHNSNYWKGVKYLGLGPSAHSFNGESRQWNVANNAHYIKGVAARTLNFEKEILSTAQQYNEYIMTSMRTIWGCDLRKIKNWGADFENYFLKNVNPFLENETVLKEDHHFYLSKKGKLLADNIAMSLFWEK